MAWTKQQKTTAILACKAAGIADEHRRLILRQLPNAMFDANGTETSEPTSTSVWLSNADFEHFMAVVERSAGGQVILPRKTYDAGYWVAKSEDRLQRARHLACRLSEALVRAGLQDAGDGLTKWIKRLTHDRADRVEDLDAGELHALINGLRAFGRRHHVAECEAA